MQAERAFSGTRLHGAGAFFSAGGGSWGGRPLQRAEGLAPKPCGAGQAGSHGHVPLPFAQGIVTRRAETPLPRLGGGA